MASIVIHFRNGDTLGIGCPTEAANAAYNAIVSAEEDFITLGVLDMMPRAGIRAADVIAVVVDPNDTTTQFWSSAGLRAIALTPAQRPVSPEQHSTVKPAATPAETSDATPERQPEYRDAGAIFSAIVTHLVDSRIRIRALLQVLGDSVNGKELTQAFAEIDARDREPLTNEILMNDATFGEKYSAWIAAQQPQRQDDAK